MSKISEMILQEVSSWDGVTVGTHRFSIRTAPWNLWQKAEGRRQKAEDLLLVRNRFSR